MADVLLPTGTVTLLLADIEGSARLWESRSDAMPGAIARHDELIEELVGRHRGARPRDQGEGDSFVAAFPRASDALTCALALQLAFANEDWADAPLRLRIALHTGEVGLRDESNYFGQAVNRCARLRAIAHGGQTLLSRTTCDLVLDRLPDGTSLKDLGQHRLKDLARAEHVFQLCHSALGAEFPALRSIDATPHNLPVQLTSFVGRDREIREISDLLASARLVTLLGPGGAGKTRLALQVAAEVLDGYPDGAWVIDLAATTDGDVVPQSIASILGIRGTAPDSVAALRGREEPSGTLLDKMLDVLRPSRALLLLDNCEHLVPECAEFTETILRSCPQVSVFVTSREPLGVPGEARWRVPPLTTPAVEVDLKEIGGYEAVGLFLDRAVLNQSDFALTTDIQAAVVDICRKLEGMPLAIELAAAWVSALSPEQILDRLDDQFRLLASGPHRGSTRQQTLRATVDWSYDLLSESERLLLENLSVFGGGFSLEGAEGVCAEGGIDPAEVVHLLSRLVDKSLVIREIEGTTVRYRLLETIRQYGWEKVAGSPATDELVTSDETADLRKEGEFWTIAYGADEFRLKDAKGLTYLHTLLSNPGREFHVLDLIGSGRAVDQDAGDILDPQARSEYKIRLTELKREVDEARAWSDDERAARAQEEIDFITQELAGAVGLGGRGRKAGATSERARMSVSKAIRTTIRKIDTESSDLGAYLSTSIRTGTFLSYVPEPRHPISWRLK